MFLIVCIWESLTIEYCVVIQRGGVRKYTPRPKKGKIQGPESVVLEEGKKWHLEYIIDCTHPVEDGIMDIGDFVSVR